MKAVAHLRHSDGFALAQILVAGIVVAALAVILGPRLLSAGGRASNPAGVQGAPRGSAQDARTQQVLATALTAASQYYMQHNESFTGLTPVVLGEMIPTLHEGPAAPGGGDPLSVSVTVSPTGGEAVLCSTTNAASAVWCVTANPKGQTLYGRGRTVTEASTDGHPGGWEG